MTRTTRTVFFFALVTLLFSGVSAVAQESRLAVSAGADYPSRYVWRGQVLNNEPCLQPTVDVGLSVPGGTLGLNWWGVLDLTDYNGEENQFTEHDWTVSYVTAVGPLELTLAYIYYYFPQITGESDTTEVSVGLSMPLVERQNFALSVGCAVNYDVENIGGYYYNVAAEASIPLSDKWSLGFSLGLGGADDNYNEGYFGVKNDGFNDITASAGLSCAIDDHSELSFSLTFSDVVDGDLEEAAEAGFGETNVYIFNVGFSHSF